MTTNDGEDNKRIGTKVGRQQMMTNDDKRHERQRRCKEDVYDGQGYNGNFDKILRVKQEKNIKVKL